MKLNHCNHIILYRAQLIGSCHISSQLSCCSTFKYLVSICCGCFRALSETLHLPQLHMYPLEAVLKVGQYAPKSVF